MLASSVILFLFSFVQYILAAALPAANADAELLHLGTVEHGLEPRQDQQCTNTAATRQCWGNGYSIATNYDAVWPNTGKIVRYTLDVQNTTMSPDGGPTRRVYAINGQYPGPVIRASWGDTLQITVRNSLTTNGTSMHWHGIRQWKSNTMDGTNGVTECPLAPGQTRTYTFLCTQFGTTWYHSHYSNQYTDGVVGTIIIDGPATSNYDIDLGTFPINDWYYTPAFTTSPLIEHAVLRGPPPADNILINGTNVAGNGTGKYNRVTLTKGKKYRLRLINIATNDNYKIGLDGHKLTVIQTDFVPVNPFQVDWLFISVGQRYDVIIDASQAVDSYWFHVVPQTGCSSNKVANAVSVFSYAGANNTLPSNSTRNNAPPTNDCTDPNSQIVPYVKLNVPSNFTIPQSSRLDVGFAIVQDAGNQTLVQWNLNFTAIDAEWDKPTLEYVRTKNTSYPASMNLINLPQANAWSYWVIQAVGTVAPPQPHPIHLHGHDFYVLGAGSGTYSDSSLLNYNNPPRRDVATLPSGGWLALAFITDNPGAWLMHCHLAFHISLGLGAQFLERPNDIPNPYNTVGWQNQCQTWDNYYSNALFKQTDSGL